MLYVVLYTPEYIQKQLLVTKFDNVKQYGYCPKFDISLDFILALVVFVI